MADAEFTKWFPASAQKRFEAFNPPNPSVVVICFPNAGNSEDVYSSEGSGARRQPSAVIEWCKANNGQLLSVQYPGRYARKAEGFIDTAQEMAEGLLPVLAPVMKSTPYYILAHSVGTWISFELLSKARQEGLPMPKQAILSGFPSPDLPVEQRPWLVGKELSEPDFKDEARRWDINEDVFNPGLWDPEGWNFHQILLHDFGIFDGYEYDDSKGEPFDFPIQTYYATRDQKVAKQMVQGWQNYTTASFECGPIEGHHLFPLDKEGKAEWLEKAAQVLEKAHSAPAAAAGDSGDDLDFLMGGDSAAPAPAAPAPAAPAPAAPAPAAAAAPPPPAAAAPAGDDDSEDDLDFFM